MPDEPTAAGGVVRCAGDEPGPDGAQPEHPGLARRSWLIDHGAALYIQHTWRDAEEHARQPFERIADHVLLPYAGSIREADERLAPAAHARAPESTVEMVPEAWLEDDALSRRGRRSPSLQREAYLDYLATRLAEPRAWVAEAERARVAQRG